ncbi:hypothetical protein BDV98DRAFT_633807 [Pterulicium gracile]|uniref:Uncharacterized protein n=1 Tax=Pterulicium gracile TaxID=1884261 RepID=A0A5C3QSP6_9AGAR|nr:hypothetical protein BDV98DRAFT_633807 [Pterula gracilis]
MEDLVGCYSYVMVAVEAQGTSVCVRRGQNAGQDDSQCLLVAALCLHRKSSNEWQTPTSATGVAARLVPTLIGIAGGTLEEVRCIPSASRTISPKVHLSASEAPHEIRLEEPSQSSSSGWSSSITVANGVHCGAKETAGSSGSWRNVLAIGKIQRELGNAERSQIAAIARAGGNHCLPMASILSLETQFVSSSTVRVMVCHLKARNSTSYVDSGAHGAASTALHAQCSKTAPYLGAPYLQLELEPFKLCPVMCLDL